MIAVLTEQSKRELADIYAALNPVMLFEAEQGSTGTSLESCQTTTINPLEWLNGTWFGNSNYDVTKRALVALTIDAIRPTIGIRNRVIILTFLSYIY
jgi:hypothetical protein